MKIIKTMWALCLLFGMNLASAGQQASDFALRSVADGNIRLSEYYGDVVMLNFWATWCGPCKQELPILEQLQKKFKRAGFTVLAINVDTPDVDVSGYLKEFNLSYPVLLDESHSVVKEYNIRAMPGSVFLSRDGEVRHVHLGYQEGDQQKYEQIIEALLKE
ncbi:TlpA family protein disulfide reductase [Litoribrevibacter albus]|uniref:Thiol:disulfide interchange protein n=1 Tax=Litoribrevibacter albus TaxID=1473156 RepID=A0AA37S8F7_9GAMM|nr:TlpA disulfide reductase family protein [Litoribrevibacter albus]GLQ30048.1 thiol:disulfide interchange protein [Litoribrevibacter albus]